MTYKIGDRVVVTEEYWHSKPHIPVGSVGTITLIQNKNNWVTFDNIKPAAITGGGWVHEEHQLRLETPLDKLL